MDAYERTVVNAAKAYYRAMRGNDLEQQARAKKRLMDATKALQDYEAIKRRAARTDRRFRENSLRRAPPRKFAVIPGGRAS